MTPLLFEFITSSYINRHKSLLVCRTEAVVKNVYEGKFTFGVFIFFRSSKPKLQARNTFLHFEHLLGRQIRIFRSVVNRPFSQFFARRKIRGLLNKDVCKCCKQDGTWDLLASAAAPRRPSLKPRAPLCRDIKGCRSVDSGLFIGAIAGVGGIHCCREN